MKCRRWALWWVLYGACHSRHKSCHTSLLPQPVPAVHIVMKSVNRFFIPCLVFREWSRDHVSLTFRLMQVLFENGYFGHNIPRRKLTTAIHASGAADHIAQHTLMFTWSHSVTTVISLKRPRSGSLRMVLAVILSVSDTRVTGGADMFPPVHHPKPD